MDLFLYFRYYYIILECEIKGISSFNKDFNSQYVTKCLRRFWTLGVFSHQLLIGGVKADFDIFEIYLCLIYLFLFFGYFLDMD